MLVVGSAGPGAALVATRASDGPRLQDMDSAELTDELRDRIKRTIRDEVSPRHVPDDILVAPGVPHTRTGKKLEVPIKKLLQGADPAKVVEKSAVDDPALLDWYADLKR